MGDALRHVGALRVEVVGFSIASPSYFFFLPFVLFFYSRAAGRLRTFTDSIGDNHDEKRETSITNAWQVKITYFRV